MPLLRQTILLILFGAFVLSYGQSSDNCIIYGKVVDADSEEPLHLVNVYLSGTTYGASTSEAGIYCMENVPAGSYQLIFQHVGYDVQVAKIQIAENQSYEIDASIKAKFFTTEEIQIVSTEPEEWQEQLKFFIRQFIGESFNAEYCEILNPEVLNFTVDPESDLFIATTDSVVRIKNYNLGYQINLVLQEFKCKEDYLLTYSIFPRFELMTAFDEDEKEEWDENRRKTYISSSRHFFSTLARRKIDEERFSITTADDITRLKRGRGFTVEGEFIRIEDMRSPLYKKLYYRGMMRVAYSPENIHVPSIVNFQSDYVIIDTLGNVLTPQSVSWGGDWYDRRVADLLPMDYIPDN
jgi:hypothetical protein